MKYKITIGLIIMGIIGGIFVVNQVNNNDLSNKTQIESNKTKVKELVEYYGSGYSYKNDVATIDSKILTISKQDKTEVKYDLPDDEFFVSIAPYYKSTHPCYIHNLTNCVGELTNETFELIIKDKKGNVIMEDTVKSEHNGFINLWLPRNEKYNLEITHNGNKINTSLSTFNNSNTCITTPLKLS